MAVINRVGGPDRKRGRRLVATDLTIIRPTSEGTDVDNIELPATPDDRPRRRATSAAASSRGPVRVPLRGVARKVPTSLVPPRSSHRPPTNDGAQRSRAGDRGQHHGRKQLVRRQRWVPLGGRLADRRVPAVTRLVRRLDIGQRRSKS